MIHINADTNLKMTIKTPHNKSTIIIPTNNKKYHGSSTKKH